MATTQETPPATDAGRISEIDALRGIAALMVVVFHYSITYDGQYTHHDGFWISFELGRTGVELFFMISGFVIFMTLDRVRTTGEFALARASRLYPTYWLCVLLTASVITLTGLPGHEVSWSQLLVNLTMLQTFVEVPNIDGVYWTMAVELAFYAWMMLALRLGVTRRIEPAIIAWFFVVVVAVAVLTVLGIARTWAISTALLAYYGHLFVAGMLFYRLKTRPSRLALWLLGVTYLLELAMRPETAVVLALWYGLFILLLTGHLRWLRQPPLLFLGAVSYPLYLLHENIGFAIIRQLYAWQVESTLALVLVPLALVLVLATAVHYAVEIPAQRAIRAHFRGRSRSEAATPALTVGRQPSAVTSDPAYNAGHVPTTARPSEEARPWRQMRPASPVPATTSRT